jgi:hypothetical protein
MMRKTVTIFVTIPLIVALIGMWVKFAPIATEAVTAAGVEHRTGAISPFELTLNNRKALPNQYYADPF